MQAAWTNFNTTLLEEYYDDMNSFPLIKVIFAMKSIVTATRAFCFQVPLCPGMNILQRTQFLEGLSWTAYVE